MTFHEFGEDTRPHIMLIHGGGNAWWNYLRQARVLARYGCLDGCCSANGRAAFS